MKRKSIYCAVAIAAVLALGAMAGCSSQPASSASASPESASAAPSASAAASEAASEASSESAAASEAVEKSQDEIIAELKESLSKVPAYKSVTVSEQTMAWLNEGVELPEEVLGTFDELNKAASSKDDEADATDEITRSSTVYKFDESGDKPKTFASFEMGDIKLQYYTDGDDAVCITDGPVYSGTVEQFDLEHAAGVDAYLKDTIGDIDTLIGCIDSVTQDEIDGVTGYELTLDTEKYIESDEILKHMADANDPVKEAAVTIGFDKDGRIVWMTKLDVFSDVGSAVLLDFADFDSTVIDPMPEATKTYEEMEADIDAKLDAFVDELEMADELQEEAESSEAAEAK